MVSGTGVSDRVFKGEWGLEKEGGKRGVQLVQTDEE